MDKYFIHFDQEGNFLGRYVSAHSEIPSDAVEVSQSLFHQTIDETDGVWKIDWKTGEIAKHPFPPVPELTFADKQAVKIIEINTAFERAASALTAGYPEAERLTWPVQQQEALAWEADPDAPTPYLDGLALARGIPAEEMRQKTLDQTKLFTAASQQLVGKRQRLRDLVYEATTQAELDAIQWDEPETP